MRRLFLFMTLIPFVGCQGVARLTGQPATYQDPYDAMPLPSIPAVQVFTGTLTASSNTVYLGDATILSIIVKVRWHGWIYQTLDEKSVPGYSLFGNVASFQGVPYPASYWIEVTHYLPGGQYPAAL